MINNFLGSQSPEVNARDALNALEMSRMAIWNMYSNNSSPPNPLNTSPPEVQREALNLAESPPPIMPSQIPLVSIKRERDHQSDINDRDYHIPPAKRGLVRNNSDLSRKNNNNINNNNHHMNNNNHNNNVTPTKVNKSIERSESPSSNENGDPHSPSRHRRNKRQQNGLSDSLGSNMLNGMQFKIISKGKLERKNLSLHGLINN